MSELDINNIYNMDCIEGMSKLDDNSIDLIVTSPPYNVGIKYDSWNDMMPWNEYLNWCEEWLQQCFRVLKPDGRICINHYLAFSPYGVNEQGEELGAISRFPLFDYRNIMTSIGFNVHKLVIWGDITCNKKSAWGSWKSASSPNIITPYEGILIAYKHQWKKTSSGESTVDTQTFMKGVSGVWDIGTTQGNTIACFPPKLPYMCIQLLTYKGDVVLDPFSGSGTTCYVAKSCDRKFIGFEISPAYHQCSIARLNGVDYKVETSTNTNGKEVLW